MILDPNAFRRVVTLDPVHVEASEADLDMIGQGRQQRGHLAMCRGLAWLLLEASRLDSPLTTSQKLIAARLISDAEWQRNPSRGVVQLEAKAAEWEPRSGFMARLLGFAADACAVAAGPSPLEGDESGDVMHEAVVA